MAVDLKVNGASHSVPAEPDTPLLYVLCNDLELYGAMLRAPVEGSVPDKIDEAKAKVIAGAVSATSISSSTPCCCRRRPGGR